MDGLSTSLAVVAVVREQGQRYSGVTQQLLHILSQVVDEPLIYENLVSLCEFGKLAFQKTSICPYHMTAS